MPCIPKHVVDPAIDNLSDYLTLIVDPTFADYQQNPHSARHAFLACVAVSHCVDRAKSKKSTADLRQKWQKQSFEFLVVDMFAHHFKHIRSSKEKQPQDGSGLPLSYLVENMDFHSLYFVVLGAIIFIKRQCTEKFSG